MTPPPQQLSRPPPRSEVEVHPRPPHSREWGRGHGQLRASYRILEDPLRRF
jgi:hypothetical protein